VGFTRQQLEAARNRSVPDLVGPEVRLLFVGINPGLWTAAAQAHFARPGNRFYPALYEAGLSARKIDATAGLADNDTADLMGRGIGITNLVNRATARAEELSLVELREGADAIKRRVQSLAPMVIGILGVDAYRAAFGRRNATRGWQEEPLEQARLYVAGNPSGLNAHETVRSLARAFREMADAAGVAGAP
jgi:TDG/mug DNA glycosylase family protein